MIQNHNKILEMLYKITDSVFLKDTIKHLTKKYLIRNKPRFITCEARSFAKAKSFCGLDLAIKRPLIEANALLVIQEEKYHHEDLCHFEPYGLGHQIFKG